MNVVDALICILQGIILIELELTRTATPLLL